LLPVRNRGTALLVSLVLGLVEEAAVNQTGQFNQRVVVVSSFYVTTGTENAGCLVAPDLALLAKVRTLIHEAFRASLPLPLLNS
jgi:hypothetical protein